MTKEKLKKFLISWLSLRVISNNELNSMKRSRTINTSIIMNSC